MQKEPKGIGSKPRRDSGGQPELPTVSMQFPQGAMQLLHQPSLNCLVLLLDRLPNVVDLHLLASCLHFHYRLSLLQAQSDIPTVTCQSLACYHAAIPALNRLPTHAPPTRPIPLQPGSSLQLRLYPVFTAGARSPY